MQAWLLGSLLRGNKCTYRKKLRQELLSNSYLKRNESKSAESGVTAPDVQNFMRGEIVVFQLSDI
ncbi:hypothetical protein D3Z53_16615 [Lachnospiraceae bacterium]|nr:hypothetical protein [Lachnospiraceae bacterium]